MATASAIYEARFDPRRHDAPKSPEYRFGVFEGLKANESGCKYIPRCPYIQGTASADAWFAGLSEGRYLWRTNN